MVLRRVVVTGLGALTPIGNNVQEYWNGLINGVSGAAPITYFDTSKFRTKFACEVKNFNVEDFIDRKEARKMDRFAQYAIVSSEEAVKDANFDFDKLDKDRVGVTSVFRFQDDKLIKQNFNLCLTRLLKISSHEIGHMFGIFHCIHSKCVMNGTNNIGETDNSTTRLCSECQQKIHFSFNINNQKRFLELSKFFKKYKLDNELSWLNIDNSILISNQ